MKDKNSKLKDRCSGLPSSSVKLTGVDRALVKECYKEGLISATQFIRLYDSKPQREITLEPYKRPAHLPPTLPKYEACAGRDRCVIMKELMDFGIANDFDPNISNRAYGDPKGVEQLLKILERHSDVLSGDFVENLDKIRDRISYFKFDETSGVPDNTSSSYLEQFSFTLIHEYEEVSKSDRGVRITVHSEPLMLLKVEGSRDEDVGGPQGVKISWVMGRTVGRRGDSPASLLTTTIAPPIISRTEDVYRAKPLDIVEEANNLAEMAAMITLGSKALKRRNGIVGMTPYAQGSSLDAQGSSLGSEFVGKVQNVFIYDKKRNSSYVIQHSLKRSSDLVEHETTLGVLVSGGNDVSVFQENGAEQLIEQAPSGTSRFFAAIHGSNNRSHRRCISTY